MLTPSEEVVASVERASASEPQRCVVCNETRCSTLNMKIRRSRALPLPAMRLDEQAIPICSPFGISTIVAVLWNGNTNSMKPNGLTINSTLANCGPPECNHTTLKDARTDRESYIRSTRSVCGLLPSLLAFPYSSHIHSDHLFSYLTIIFSSPFDSNTMAMIPERPILPASPPANMDMSKAEADQLALHKRQFQPMWTPTNWWFAAGSIGIMAFGGLMGGKG